MLLKQLYVLSSDEVTVVLRYAVNGDGVLYCGRFESFPYRYANCIVSSFDVKGDSMVIWIYD